MTTAETQQNRRWESDYEVTADYLPYRRWHLRAGGERSARAAISAETGIPVEELCAALKLEEVQG